MPFVYYGGKKGLARHYPPPGFDTIVEPFAGSAGYALHWWRPGVRVILVERDPAVVGLWRRLQAPDARDDLMSVELPGVGGRIVDNPLLAVMLGREAVGGRRSPTASPITTTDPLVTLSGAGAGALANAVRQQDARGVPFAPFVAGASQQAQTVLAGRSFQVTSRMARDWSAHRARIIRALPTIRTWEIIEGDYTAAPDVRATWFVDPPYWVPDDARGTRGDVYRFGASMIDYDALGEWCRSRRGQVIVCEQDGASWLPFRPMREMTTANGAGGLEQRRLEVVWSMTPGRSLGAAGKARRDDARARRSARMNRR